MTDDLAEFLTLRPPTADRPLLGLTVLVVEDSRFASEAMRLLCLRSGARIRRADCLRSARRHLQTYRPSVTVVDMGLPDGSGADLIREIAAMTPRVPVVLGTSGDPTGEALARAAGADGFIGKPIESLALFQQAVLRHLPDTLRPQRPCAVTDDMVVPDQIALRDDLSHVVEVLSSQDDAMLDYVAQFLAGVARSAHDSPLEAAAVSLAAHRQSGGATQTDVDRITGLVQERLAAAAGF